LGWTWKQPKTATNPVNPKDTRGLLYLNSMALAWICYQEERISSISSTGSEFVIHTNSGHTYLDTSYGAQTIAGYPHYVVALKGVSVNQISFTKSCIAVCTDGGEIYTWGSKALGHGLPRTKQHITKVEALIPTNGKAVSLSQGSLQWNDEKLVVVAITLF